MKPRAGTSVNHVKFQAAYDKAVARFLEITSLSADIRELKNSFWLIRFPEWDVLLESGLG
jgi:hypothetical protein